MNDTQTLGEFQLEHGIVQPNSPHGQALAKLKAAEERVVANSNRWISAQRQLDVFRNQVRDKLIELAEEHSHCDEGLNEVLDDLGLPKKETTFSVTLHVTVEHVVEITATDEDEAGDLAEQNFDSGELESYPEVAELAVYRVAKA